MDLSITIAGVKFPSCFMNASGALCMTREELLALGRSRSGAIVTKSMTVEPRDGNPEPRYYGFPGGSINSMGLPNLGYRAYAELIPELKQFGKPVIAGKDFIARGGINEQTIEEAYHLGFKGAALNSYLWKSENPFQKYVEILDFCKEKGIPVD